ncbi:kynureninase [Povalibacter uvarum]|uniref:Kynureninase n=2 Tax=Povalibacter uvarum TaxID=732238 RepID=A0A841HPV8_9GAMM|nr:kynureninase [Povalibacter uvarum]MBB6094369.1 kynureninase [Povalibacter uvarum]
MNGTPDRDALTRMDATDPLANLRNEFHIPPRADGSPSVYFCGHSLGLQPKRTATILNEELATWAKHGVEGHFEPRRPWLSYHEQLTGGLARLTGALPSEVVAMNSLTVNLHLMLTSFYRPTKERSRIVIERSAFPSDRYAVASQIAQRGFDPAACLVQLGPRPDEVLIRTDDVCEFLEREGSTIATVMFPGVQYLSGQWFDMKQIVSCAHAQGIVVGFDLAHAVGNVPLALHDSNADFAVWCSYKYLNSGPGAIGGCFVHERHARAFDLPRFAGWWGHDKSSRFEMPEAFRPLPGAEGWQLSNPSIFSAAPLLASLELFDRAGMDALRKKALALTGCLSTLLQERLRDRVSILTPADPAQRGCQLSLRLHRPPAAARAVHTALTTANFTCDWREPDVIRVAPVPLYNTFSEVGAFVEALARALNSDGRS